MECLILGSGTILQKKYLRNCSGYLIDRVILLDCGPGVWQALGASGLTADRLHYIFLSHFHVDHVADLLPFLLARFLLLKAKKTELKIYGPPGLREWFRQLSAVAGSWVSTMRISLTELTGPVKANGYHISPAPTSHTDASLCYRITGSDKKVLFYSGDSDYHRNLIKQASMADLCILEASNTEVTKVAGHLTPALAGKIAQEAGVKVLVLTHMYPEVEAIDAEREAGKNFDGSISLARDGTNFKF